MVVEAEAVVVRGRATVPRIQRLMAVAVLKVGWSVVCREGNFMAKKNVAVLKGLMNVLVEDTVFVVTVVCVEAAETGAGFKKRKVGVVMVGE